jgi:hypothetical protein
MHTKTSYIEGTSLQLDLWGEQFATLEDELSKPTSPDRADLQRKLDRLKKERRTLKRRLREAARGDKATNWEDVREPLEAAVEDFRALAGEVYDEVGGA